MHRLLYMTSMIAVTKLPSDVSSWTIPLEVLISPDSPWQSILRSTDWVHGTRDAFRIAISLVGEIIREI